MIVSDPIWTPNLVNAGKSKYKALAQAIREDIIAARAEVSFSSLDNSRHSGTRIFPADRGGGFYAPKSGTGVLPDAIVQAYRTLSGQV